MHRGVAKVATANQAPLSELELAGAVEDLTMSLKDTLDSYTTAAAHPDVRQFNPSSLLLDRGNAMERQISIFPDGTELTVVTELASVVGTTLPLVVERGLIRPGSQPATWIEINECRTTKGTGSIIWFAAFRGGEQEINYRWSIGKTGPTPPIEKTNELPPRQLTRSEEISALRDALMSELSEPAPRVDVPEKISPLRKLWQSIGHAAIPFFRR